VFARLLLTTILIAGFSSLGVNARALAKSPPVSASEWKGEYFDQKQGGVYLKMQLSGFPGGATSNVITGNIQIALYNILQESTYILSYSQTGISGPPRQIWKIPTGKYLIQQITLVDANGGRRLWQPTQERRTVVVARQCLSNLGLWSIGPSSQAGMNIAFNMTPNSYVEEGPKGESSVAAVVDGFTGRIQQVFGGKSVIEKAKTEYADANEMRTTVRMTRQIAMFFKLDLFQNNAYAREIAGVLSAIDPNLRQCYIRHLEDNPQARGTMNFGFILSKDTGQMKKLRLTGGTMNDPTMTECLTQEMSITQFPAKENMIGELSFTFQVQ
jgi:hypothetical protein